MAVSNRERVGRGFEQLAHGLEPFVDSQMRRATKDGDWAAAFVASSRRPDEQFSTSDPAFLLRVMTECWDSAFRTRLNRTDRNVVFELRDARNNWAHNKAFSAQDALRVLDSTRLLLQAVDAHEADAVEEMQNELGRIIYESARDSAGGNVLDAPPKGLLPWRQVILPHDDVTEGRYNVAEFAADLQLVRLGEGRAEYTDPVEFFRRTYLTTGLRQLLTDAARRIAGTGGSPVVNLQTNFGGGKTHSLIALYHLFCGLEPDRFPPEVATLLTEAEVESLPPVARAVVVGNKFPAGEASVKNDGTAVNTLWGELAWQLGGADGYAIVGESDRNRTSPGDRLRELLQRYAPCLILIDEWVAYARDLYERDDLPGGSFDTQFTFAQTLTEAARGVDGVLFVVSIPASEAIGTDTGRNGNAKASASDLEVGGAGGREALKRLTNVVSRQAEHWRPASAEESFEIVRRRLFKPLDDDAVAARDATADAFGEAYRRQRNEFPPECSEHKYVARIKAAYPIHPEVFDRLYQDWSTLERFQRTRGVLRLMALVIHALWVRDDKSPMILPASIPLDDGPVNSELTRVLDDIWKPVIDADVDGPESRPVHIDRQFQNLGKYHATRRVARTVFLGSAPTLRSPNKGIDAQRIRLGSCFPGESVPIFGDALNRLSDQAPHLYVDRSRYWFDLQENVTRTAREEAERLLGGHRDEVHAEIVRRLQSRSDQGEFRGVHVAPRTSDDVKDDPIARLVVLGPDSPHIARAEESPALAAARELLERRGSSPRLYRNMVVFAAADQRRLEDLERAAADFLAWRRIDDEADERNLDAFQRTQARTKRQDSDQAITLRISETYQWALVPTQPDPAEPIHLEEHKLDSQGSVAQRSARKLIQEGALAVAFPAVMLRLQLDGPLASMWDSGDVSINTLWDAFAKYVYLPRLRDIDVLVAAAAQGPASTTWQSEGFATAATFDSAKGRYLDLAHGSHPGTLTPTSLLVKPEFALGQLEQGDEAGSEDQPHADAGDDAGAEPDSERPATRFHGAVRLDPGRINKSFGTVQAEVIENLTTLLGCDVEVTVEIHATKADGFDPKLVRDVTQNLGDLSFEAGSGFEEH